MTLKKGYTTGSCAQGAAKAATLTLLGRRRVDQVELETPSGIKLLLPVIDTELGDHYARCGVVKDSGDDPDVTHGARIYATVRFSDTPGVTIRGGKRGWYCHQTRTRPCPWVNMPSILLRGR